MDKIQHFEGYDERNGKIFLSEEDDDSKPHGWRRIEIDFGEMLGVNRCSAHPKGRSIITTLENEAITIDIGYKTFLKLMQRLERSW